MNIPDLLKRCADYCDDSKMSEARLSTIIFGSGVTISRLRSGKGVTVRVLERAHHRLEGLERGEKPRQVLTPCTAAAA